MKLGVSSVGAKIEYKVLIIFLKTMRQLRDKQCCSAVARGGARGGEGRALPSLFSKKVKTVLYKMSKINIIKQLFGKFSKNGLRMKSMFASKAAQTV